MTIEDLVTRVTNTEWPVLALLAVSLLAFVAWAVWCVATWTRGRVEVRRQRATAAKTKQSTRKRRAGVVRATTGR